MQGVSVIICCYNSASRIEPTLEYLCKQTLLSEQMELILVDNNCTDNTVELAEKILESASFSYQIIQEFTPGLSSARMAGIKQSKFNLVAYVDDDNWLEPEYLSQAIDIFEDPIIGIVGGCGLPETSMTLPFWFESFKHQYAIGPQYKIEGKLPKDAYVYGAGMVLRKEPFLKILNEGISFKSSDRVGKKLISGGDVEINHWFALSGFEIYYHATMNFKHFIPSERLTWEYLQNLSRQSGPSNMGAVVMHFMDRDPNLSLKSWRRKQMKRYFG